MKWLAALAATTSLAHAEPGFFATAGGGTNVGTPFAAVGVGRRFVGAPFLELALAYSYDRAISELPFQTLGLAVRTYVARFARVELYHQATASLAMSSSGAFHDRKLGDRLLGPMLTMGLGVEVALDPCWAVALAVSTGTPVWLRPELAVRYAF